VFERVSRDQETRAGAEKGAGAVFGRATRTEMGEEAGMNVAPAVFERVSREDVARAEAARNAAARAAMAAGAEPEAMERRPPAETPEAASLFVSVEEAQEAAEAAAIAHAREAAERARETEQAREAGLARRASLAEEMVRARQAAQVRSAEAKKSTKARAAKTAEPAGQRKATRPVKMMPGKGTPAEEKPVKVAARRGTGGAAAKGGHGLEEWAQPYRKAELAPLPAGAGIADPGTHERIVEAIRRIAEVEGPVHITIALQRLRDEWALTRITKQARAAVDAAIAESGVVWDGEFLSDPGQLAPVVRLRAEGVARKADQIADSELRIALEQLAVDAGAIDVDGLLAATGRLYGWASRRSTEVDARLTTIIADLVADGRLLRRADGLSAAHDLPDPLSLPRHDAAPARSSRRRSRT
ncbi:DUF3320 domain-containing protein, partial [Actinoplanes campanulatus]|uniref:DUF3320 domain-containing protein n=1 Tax=Actinoplanes campanulatus TaxID=113559 RepID=UPI0031DC60CF